MNNLRINIQIWEIFKNQFSVIKSLVKMLLKIVIHKMKCMEFFYWISIG